jgi:6-phosphogluconate dehydrogenase
MGANMTRRLLLAGHQLVAFDLQTDAVQAVVAGGARGAHTAGELCAALTPPRIVWLMVPAGSVDRTIDSLLPHLEAGDLLVDGGNSLYHDDIRRASELAARGLLHMDVGVSGGVWGLERGYCLMAGGTEEAFRRVEPLLAALAPGFEAVPRGPGREGHPSAAELGYLHCGPAGAGHFVKMVHNAIEYGLMASYAEGFSLLSHAGAGRQARAGDAETAPLAAPEHFQYEFDLAAIAEVWRRGSVVSSWLLDLTANALTASPGLDGFEGQVSDSGEGRWAVAAAIDSGTPAPVLATALFERFSSRGEGDFGRKLLSALRAQFGGHAEKEPHS